jgi:hypothetical protein
MKGHSSEKHTRVPIVVRLRCPKEGRPYEILPHFHWEFFQMLDQEVNIAVIRRMLVASKASFYYFHVIAVRGQILGNEYPVRSRKEHQTHRH